MMVQRQERMLSAFRELSVSQEPDVQTSEGDKSFKRGFICSFNLLLGFFFFLAELRGIQDLSSLTKNRTRAPCSGHAES